MRLYFLLMMIVCLGYYAVILMHTRRWDSTFSGFWFFMGLLHAVAAIVWKMLPDTVQVLVCALLTGGWLCFVLVEVKIVLAMYRDVEWIPEYLIVLGAQVRGTFITNSLKRRLDKAHQFWKLHPQIKIVVSGGQGRGEDISEAEAMEEYLIFKGVPSGHVLKEKQSTSTRENLLFSEKLIGGKEKRIGIVTNNFHIYRALILAKSMGFEKICGIPAGSNKVLLPNYMVREFFAILWIRIKSLYRCE